MIIGKIVSSNSHTDLMAQVYRPGERDQTPRPDDYAFGTFVSMPVDSRRQVVGLIYDTLLVNPEYGRGGPRLTTDIGLERFMPDYILEKATMVGIVTLGTVCVDEQGCQVDHGVPALPVELEADVEVLGNEEVKAFHIPQGVLALGYLPRLMAQSRPCMPGLIERLVDRIEGLFPTERTRLGVLRTSLAWRNRVEVLR
jgi:hypothetical protein